MKRVLMLSTLHPHDDIRIYHKEAMALLRAGYPVVVACPGEPPWGLATKTIGLPLPGGRLRRMAGSWLVGVEAGISSGAKIIHFHDPELLPAGLILKMLGKRVVYDAHEDLPRQLMHKPYFHVPIKRILSFIVAFSETRAAGYCDLVIGATPAISRRFGGVTVRNLPDSRELRLSDLSRNPRQICYIGAVSEVRGIFPMIEAARLAGVHLMVAGACENADLEHRLRIHRHRDSFTLLGRVDRHQVANLLAESACGLCVLADTPAYQEAIPVKLLEYMLAGLPFVASDFPYWRNIGGEGGLYVRPDDVRGIAKAICSITDDPVQAGRLSAAGWKRARAFSFENEEKRLIEAYQTYLGG